VSFDALDGPSAHRAFEAPVQAAAPDVPSLAPILLGVVLPWLIAGAVLLLAAVLTRRRCGAWAGILALGVGYVAGHIVVRGWPSFPPGERTDWLFYLALVLVILGLVEARWLTRASFRWGLRSIVFFVAVLLIVFPRMRDAWQPVESVAWLAALLIAGVAAWLSLDGLVGRAPAWSFLGCLALTVAGSAVVAFKSGLAVMALLEFGLLATVLGLLLAGCASKTLFAAAQGGAAGAGLLQPAMWLIGYFLAEVPSGCALLLGVALHTTWLVEGGPLRRLRPWQRGILAMVAAAGPVLLAVWIAYLSAPTEEPWP
jgi:hypothetical protein